VGFPLLSELAMFAPQRPGENREKTSTVYLNENGFAALSK
jgi:hypothetical protein